MTRIILLVLAFLALHGTAQAQWPGQCPAGVASTSIGCQPAAVTPLATDLVLGWQVGQSPRTRAMQVQQISGPYLSATQYGTPGVWDGAHDVSASLALGVTAALAAKSCLIVPAGSFPLASAQFLQQTGICIKSSAAGWGAAYNTYSAGMIFPTTFKWTGSAGATMFTVAPIVSTGTMLQSIVIEGIALDGQSVAATGWSIKSMSNSNLSIATQNTTGPGSLFDTETLVGGQTTGTQVNEISIACNNTGTDGDCIKVLNTNTNGNLSLNHFKRVVLNNRNGWGINIPGTASNQSDNNYFENAVLYRTGTSGGVNLGFSGQNHFAYLSSAGGITVSAYSNGNLIDVYDTGNGSPAPTVTLGGDIQWRDTYGHTNYVNTVGVSTSQQGNVMAASAQAIDLYNASPAFNPNAQLVCVDTASSCITISTSDGSKSWTINIDGTNGNLRIGRQQGTGLLTLGNGGQIQATTIIGPTAGSLTLGSGSTLATTATTGFIEIPAMAGAPTGVPAGNGVAMVWDSTNKKLCIFSLGGGWECSGAFSP